MSILAGSKYLFIGGIVAGALAATSPAVLADGMAPKAKAMEAPATWSGFYIGTNSGWAPQSASVAAQADTVSITIRNSGVSCSACSIRLAAS
jgi:hypothetical protein